MIQNIPKGQEPAKVEPIIDTSDIGIVKGDPIDVDLFSTQIKTGLTIPEILGGMTPKDGFIPLRTRDSYWSEFGDKFATEDDFNKMFDDTVKNYDEARLSVYKKNLTFTGSEKYGIGLEEDPMFGRHTARALYGYADTYDSRARRNPLLMESPSQNASRNNWSMSMESRFNKKEGRLELAPQYRNETPSKFDRYLHNWYIDVQRDEDGETVVDRHGRPQYMYKQFGDNVPHYNLEKAAIWGDRKLYGDGILNGVAGLLSTMTMDLTQSIAQIGKILNDGVGYAVIGDDYKDIKHLLPDIPNIGISMGAMNRFYDLIIDRTETFKWNPSEELTQSTFFGSGISGFTYQVGVGFGYIMPQRMGASLLSTGLKITSKRALWGMATFIGTSQAINGGYRAAREAGLSEKDATMWSIAAMPAVALTEWGLNRKWITVGLGTDELTAVTKRLQKSLVDLKKAGIDASTEKGRALSIKKTFNALLGDESFLKAIGKGRVIGPSLREGTQEGLEESIYALLETAYDSRLVDRFLGVDLDGPSGIPGEGSFGTDIRSDEFRERLKENFIGGLVIGGMMDAGMLGQKERYRESVFEDMILRGDTQKLLGFVDKSYGSGKLGPMHQDISGNVIFSDDDGNPVGKTEVVENDVVFEGKTYFEKGDELKTLNDLNYYNTVLGIIGQHEVAESAGLLSPEILMTYSGQEELLKDGLDIFKQSQEITEQINSLEKSKEVEGAKVAEIDAKINALIDQRDGVLETVKDKDGNEKRVLKSRGLKQEWDYLMKPVEAVYETITDENGKEKRILKSGGSKYSQAYIDNVKNALFNGYRYNKKKGKYEAENTMPTRIGKDKTIALDGIIGNLMSLREKDKTKRQEQIKREIENVGKVAEAIGSIEKKGLATSEINKVLSILNQFETEGISEETIVAITEQVQELAAKFSASVKEQVEEFDIEFGEDESIATRLQIAGYTEADPKGEISVEVVENLENLERMALATTRLTKIGETIDEDKIKRKGQYTPMDDLRKISIELGIIDIGGGNSMYAKDLIEDLMSRAKTSLDDPGVNEEINSALQAIAWAQNTIEWAESMNSFSNDPDYSGILDIDPKTEFIFESKSEKESIDFKEMSLSRKRLSKFGVKKQMNIDVVPGRDIPDEYISDLKAEFNKYRADLDNLSAQARKDIQDNAFAEKRKRVASISKKTKMLNRIFNNNTSHLSVLAKSIEELNGLHDEMMKDRSKLTDDQILNTEKKTASVETDIYSIVKNNPALHKIILEETLDKIATGVIYSYADENRHNYIQKRDNTVVSQSELTYDELAANMDEANFNVLMTISLTNYINNIIAIPANNFNAAMNEIVAEQVQEKEETKEDEEKSESDKRIERAKEDKDINDNIPPPGVEQTEAIRTIITVTVGHKINPKFKFLARDKNGKINPYEDAEANMSIYKLNAVHVDGSAGTGKTTVVVAAAMAITNEFYKKFGIRANVTGVAPSDSLTSILGRSIRGNSNLNLNSLVDAKKFMADPNKYIKDDDSIIIIDESSRLDIEFIMKFTKMMSGRNNMIIFLGDSSQASELSKSGSSKVAALNVGIRVPKMNMKFRSGIAMIGFVQDAIDRSMKGAYSDTDIKFPGVLYNTEHTKGVLYSDSPASVIEQWKKDVVSGEGNSRHIIFETQKEAEDFQESLDK